MSLIDLLVHPRRNRARLLDVPDDQRTRKEIRWWSRLHRRLRGQHFAGLSSLVANISTRVTWQAANNLTGSTYSPNQNNSSIAKSQNLGTAAANAAVNGSDEIFSFQQNINGAASATLDLNALTNIMSQTSVAMIRIKAIHIRLLSTTDDSTVPTTAGSTASSFTVTNNGPAVPSPFDFGDAGTGFTVAITAAGAITAVAVGAGGTVYRPSQTMLFSPQQTGGSGCVFAATTNGSGVVTSATFIAGAGGAGYTTATVPAIQVGAYTILSGGVHCYFDSSAAGNLLVSATSRNVKVFNNDPTNVGTLEFTVIGGTS